MPTSATGGPMVSFSELDVGDYHTCGLSGGTLFCWGDFGFGAFGDGAQSVSLTPVLVSGL